MPRLVRTKVDVEVETWDELQSALLNDSFWDGIRRFRTKRLFRGLSSADYHLSTTLQRMKDCACPERGIARLWNMKAVEPKMIRNFLKYAHRDIQALDSIWKHLAMAQHHGLPTRLLDWTNSPFVALHFTVCEPCHFQRHGAIWAVNFPEICRRLPRRLHRKLSSGGVKVFTADELVKARVTSLDRLRQLSRKEFMLFFEPPSIDDRIINQYALMSVMSTCAANPEAWLEARGEKVCRRIVFPAKLKPEIRDRLDMMNVTERSLFPGLDGLTAWLRRYYGPTFWTGEQWRSFKESMKTEANPSGCEQPRARAAAAGR